MPTTQTQTLTNTELVASMIQAVEAVQDVQDIVVQEAKKLAAHQTNPDAHGLNNPNGDVLQSINITVLATMSDIVGVETKARQGGDQALVKALEEEAKARQTSIEQVQDNLALKIGTAETRGGYRKGDGLNITETDKLNVNIATESMRGIARVATQAEVNTGVTGENAPAFVTPETLPQVSPYVVGDWYYRRETTPPTGFLNLNGALIVNADTAYPKLWAFLQTPIGQEQCKTEAEWGALSAATRPVGGVQVPIWDGIGGVPFFVIDIIAKTIRLPDTRGMYGEGAGFDGLEVGGVHGEGLPEIEGTFFAGSGGLRISWGTPSGAIVLDTPVNLGYSYQIKNFTVPSRFSFKSSRTVVTTKITQPRAYGVLHCVYVGV